MNKRIKPNLLDPSFGRKITKTLNPPKENYWEPTQKFLQNVYTKYIKQNIYIIIFIYRYKKTQQDRIKNKTNSDNFIEDYSNLALETYNQDKELSREPKMIKQHNSKRIEYAKNDINPKLMYPLYPYTKDGTLIPSAKR